MTAGLSQAGTTVVGEGVRDGVGEEGDSLGCASWAVEAIISTGAEAGGSDLTRCEAQPATAGTLVGDTTRGRIV